MSVLIKQVSLEGETVDIYIEGNRLVRIGEALSFPADRVIDGRRKAVIPGLVNGHTHAAMTLFRGFGDDMPLMPWLERYPILRLYAFRYRWRSLDDNPLHQELPCLPASAAILRISLLYGTDYRNATFDRQANALQPGFLPSGSIRFHVHGGAIVTYIMGF